MPATYNPANSEEWAALDNMCSHITAVEALNGESFETLHITTEGVLATYKEKEHCRLVMWNSPHAALTVVAI